jgi:hypothetical protein
VFQAGSSRIRFPIASLEFFIYVVLPHYGTGIDSIPSRNEYQKYFLGGGVREGKMIRYVQLTTLTPSSADCLEIWEPRPTGTIRPVLRLYKDCFTFAL